MSNTAKTHKSRKTGAPGKPRQRTKAAVKATVATGTPPVESSLVPATTTPIVPAIVTTPDAPIMDVPAELPKEQQHWYRSPDSKLRAQSTKIAVMRAAGRPTADIAKRMKTSDANVRFVEYIARKNGWYDEDDEPVDLEAELANNIDRKIVRNISASLDGQMTNWQTHEMTVKAASGRGFFKNHDKVEGQIQQLQVVAIRVEMPTMGAEQQLVNEDNIGGVPAYLEADVVQAALPAGENHERLDAGYSRREAEQADTGTV